MTKPRWEEILDEFAYPAEDATYTTREREMAEQIADLENTIRTLHEPVVDQRSLKYYASETKSWLRPETLNTNGSMMLKPFFDTIEQYQKEVYCDGEGGIASHNIPSNVCVKLFNPQTGEDMWAKVKWVEPTMMMGCGCWDGIKIVAELDK